MESKCNEHRVQVYLHVAPNAEKCPALRHGNQRTESAEGTACSRCVNSDAYTAKRVDTAADGTQVPMSMVHRKDVTLTADTPPTSGPMEVTGCRTLWGFNPTSYRWTEVFWS